MTDKKISELPNVDFVRADDEILVTTGLRVGETPTTKKIAVGKSRLVGEQRNNAEQAIMQTNPKHYWPVDAFVNSSLEVVTQTLGAITPKYQPAPAYFGERPLKNFVPESPIGTGNTIEWGERFSLVLAFRAIASARGICGNLNADTPIRTGAGVGVNNLSNNFYARIYVDAGTLFAINVPGFTNLNFWVVAWTFDVDEGHKFYRNGDLVLSNADKRLARENTTEFFILGHEQPKLSGSTGYTGDLQDVAFWDRTLTAQEVLDISTAILGA
jgi:hypothetical protein